MKDIAVMIISLCRNTAPLLKKKNGLLATTNWIPYKYRNKSPQQEVCGKPF